jgi:hypothetical protein
MHIEKKSLVSKRAAAATIIAINSRRVDLSKPAPAPRTVSCLFWCMLVCVVLAV